VARGSEAGEGGKKDGRGLSLELRTALIGIISALVGTLVGGAVTWAITHEQIANEKTEARRAERLDAYSKYFGDAARLWTEVFDVYEVTPPPKTLTAAETTPIKELQATLTREYALVALVAPDSVRNVARQLNNVNTDVYNALASVPIQQAQYERAKRQATEGQTNLLAAFLDAAKRDLGTGGG